MTSSISRARAPPNRRSSTCSMSPQPGEIWLADLGLAAKTRPVVIVSRSDPDPPRALIFYVPLTTQYRQSPYEVVLPEYPGSGEPRITMAQCELSFFCMDGSRVEAP